MENAITYDFMERSNLPSGLLYKFVKDFGAKVIEYS